MTVYAQNGLVKQDNEWNVKPDTLSTKILIVNLMPTKLETEKQFLNLLEKTEENIQVTLTYPDSHHFHSKNVEDIKRNYEPLSQAMNKHYSGVIVTGAPVEHLDFEQVDYWKDFAKLVRWIRDNDIYTIFECWASQAALNLIYGIEKIPRQHKLFGVYQSKIEHSHNLFLKGLGSGGVIRMPQSRHTNLKLPTSLPKGLELLASSNDVEAFIMVSSDLKQIYITGHPEYNTNTLDDEYKRDCQLGKSIQKPKNYYQNNKIVNSWESTSVALYKNWLEIIRNEELL